MEHYSYHNRQFGRYVHIFAVKWQWGREIFRQIWIASASPLVKWSSDFPVWKDAVHPPSEWHDSVCIERGRVWLCIKKEEVYLGYSSAQFWWIATKCIFLQGFDRKISWLSNPVLFEKTTNHMGFVTDKDQLNQLTWLHLYRKQWYVITHRCP